eukprot:TRINITY_DN18722_c0_g1_i1.p1 TRINITY_DN18722_c0_g1~~TRINITY_DN18722_c0_g1_i1.p1  ORF type:complete len:411 (+),score=111.52 TRINITY_DN18722_c0_g1_i1:90-1322(+)
MLSREAARRAARPNWTWSDAAIAKWVEKQLQGQPRNRRLPRMLREYLDRLRREKCDIGDHCKAALVRVEAQHGEVQEALGMAGGVNDISAVSRSVAKALAHVEDFNGLCALAAQEQKVNGVLSAGMYYAFLKYYAATGGAKEAGSVIENMGKAGHTVSLSHRKLHLLACRSLDEAEAHAAPLREAGADPGVVRELVLLACLRGGDVAAAEGIAASLAAERVSLKPSTIAALADGLAEHRRWDELVCLFDVAARTVRAAPWLPDALVSSVLLCARKGVEAAPNAAPQFNVYVRLGEAFAAPYLPPDLRVGGIEPGPLAGSAASTKLLTNIHTRLVDLYCAAELPERAEDVVAAMRRHPRVGDVWQGTLQAVAAAYRRAGDVDRAAGVLTLPAQLNPSGIRPEMCKQDLRSI